VNADPIDKPPMGIDGPCLLQSDPNSKDDGMMVLCGVFRYVKLGSHGIGYWVMKRGSNPMVDLT
jgi:hypothetical protein